MKTKIIIDSNVILSGLKSKNVYSYKLLQLIPENKFDTAISVPLILEYESILTKYQKVLGLTKIDIDNFINYICSDSEHTKIYYLWRPFLKDPYDDHLLEVAVASESKYIITFNIKDFIKIEQFGIKALKPKDFIRIIGGKI
jgi:putative PIN family toxin of toxin-antitoxin system